MVNIVDSNVWYNIISKASGNQLSYDDVPGPISVLDFNTSWQILDPVVASGGEASNLWILRSENAGPFACMSVTGSTAQLQLCDRTSTWWLIQSYNDTKTVSFYNNSQAVGGFMAVNNRVGPPIFEQSLPEDNSRNSVLWELRSVSKVDNETWSSLPWDTPQTSAGATTTTTSGNAPPQITRMGSGTSDSTATSSPTIVATPSMGNTRTITWNTWQVTLLLGHALLAIVCAT